MKLPLKIRISFFMLGIQCVNFAMERPVERSYDMVRQLMSQTLDSIAQEGDTTELLGYPIKVITDLADDVRLVHRCPTMYSMGFVPLPATTIFKKAPNRIFFGDVFVYDAHINKKHESNLPRSIKIPLAYLQSLKCAQFGQYEDMASLAWILKHAHQSGITQVTLDGICYGARREMMMIIMLYLMEHNDAFVAQYPSLAQKYEEMFNRIGFTPKDYRDILSMINGVIMQAPLKEIYDGVECIADPLVRSNLTISAATSTLISEYPIMGYTPFAALLSCGVGAAVYVQQNKWMSSIIASTSEYITKNIVPKISLYQSDEPSLYDLLNMINTMGFAQEYPNISFLITTQKDDNVVGGNVSKIAQLVRGLNATIMPSCKSDHVNEDKRQAMVRNAFRRTCGGTYINNQVSLMQGQLWIDFVHAKCAEIGVEKTIEYLQTPESCIAIDRQFQDMVIQDLPD